MSGATNQPGGRMSCQVVTPGIKRKPGWWRVATGPGRWCVCGRGGGGLGHRDITFTLENSVKNFTFRFRITMAHLNNLRFLSMFRSIYLY